MSFDSRQVSNPASCLPNSVQHPQATVQNSPLPSGRWLSVKALANLYPEVASEASLRALIWEAEAYAKHPKSGLKSNGFQPVIVRPPNQRKVLLDRVEFENWLTSRQQKRTYA